MNKHLRPEEAERFAREIESALRPLDEEPSPRIQPDAIVRLLQQERETLPAVPPFYKKKRWIAAAATLAACVALVVWAGVTGWLRAPEKDHLNKDPGDAGRVSTAAGTQTAPTDAAAGLTAPSSDHILDGDFSSEAAGGALSTAGAANTTVRRTSSVKTSKKGTTKATAATTNKVAGGTQATKPQGVDKPANPGAVECEWPPIAEKDLPALLEDGALLLDVRGAAAFAAGHIDGAINLPAEAIAADTVTAEMTTRPLILYGLSGGDCQRIGSLLTQLGCTIQGYLPTWTGATVQ